MSKFILACLISGPFAAYCTSADVCSRSKGVRDTLVDALDIPCESITLADLVTISGTLAVMPDDLTNLALQSGDFVGLSAVTDLDLSWGVVSVTSGTFTGLTAVERISLANGFVTTLPADIFSGLTTLKKLGLNEGALTSVPDGIFDNLPNLQTLSLRVNKITDFSDHVFDPEKFSSQAMVFVSGNPLSASAIALLKSQLGNRVDLP